MRRRKELVNYAIFLCFSIPGQVRGKIGKAERERMGSSRREPRMNFLK